MIPTEKRSNPVHDTLLKEMEEHVKENDDMICLVCNSVIIEGDGNEVTGDGAVYCEGMVALSMHKYVQFL